MKINVELGGGIELLFEKKKKLEINLDKTESCKIQDVINEMTKIISEKPELFINKENGKLRPGIIVLYNDADWEIYEKEDTLINNGDTLSFISTLHGG